MSSRRNKIKSSDKEYSPMGLFFSSYFWFFVAMGLFNFAGILIGVIKGKGLLIGSKLAQMESPDIINQIRVVLYESFVFKRSLTLFAIVYGIFLLRVLIWGYKK